MTVIVRAPGSSANLGPGFDALGLAIGSARRALGPEALAARIAELALLPDAVGRLLADTTPMSMMLEGNRIAKGAPAIAVPRGRL